MKVNKEENLTKYARSIYAYAKKAEKNSKSDDEESGEQAEKAKPISVGKCSILMFKVF